MKPSKAFFVAIGIVWGIFAFIYSIFLCAELANWLYCEVYNFNSTLIILTIVGILSLYVGAFVAVYNMLKRRYD
jgi:hypothetical protein